MSERKRSAGAREKRFLAPEIFSSPDLPPEERDLITPTVFAGESWLRDLSAPTRPRSASAIEQKQEAPGHDQ